MMTVRATFNTRRGRARIQPLGEVIGWQEVNKPADRDKLKAALPGYEHFIPNAEWAAAIPISWLRDRFTLVDSGIVKAHDGKAGVTPARGCTWVLLQDGADNSLVWHINAHFISKTRLSVWRREQWAKHLVTLRDLVTTLAARSPLGTIGGDFNNHDAVKFPGVVNLTPKWRGDKVWYDQLLVTDPLAASASVRKGSSRLGSDHWPFMLTYTPPTEGDSMRGFMPGAIVKNIPPGSNDPGIVPVGGVCHVAVSEADSLFDFFANRSGGIESHFYVRRDGAVEQYRSVYFEADANLDGNSFIRDGKRCGLVSIETQGMAAGEWTDAQVASIKAIMSWLNTEAGVKLQVIPKWDGDGWGYHTMWGAPSHWTPVAKTCPGPDRVKQFNRVLAPWLKAGGKDPAPKPPAPNKVQQAHDLEQEIRGDLRKVAAKFTRLDALLEQVDPSRTAVAKWRAALDDIDAGITALRVESHQASDKAPEK